jgi:hypothetical protein
VEIGRTSGDQMHQSHVHSYTSPRQRRQVWTWCPATGRTARVWSTPVSTPRGFLITRRVRLGLTRHRQSLVLSNPRAPGHVTEMGCENNVPRASGPSPLQVSGHRTELRPSLRVMTEHGSGSGPESGPYTARVWSLTFTTSSFSISSNTSPSLPSC